MNLYQYFNFHKNGYLSYAVLTKPIHNLMHLYVLDPVKGSKEYEIEAELDAKDNQTMANEMVLGFIEGDMEEKDEASLSDLRNAFYEKKLSDGSIALIHQVFFPDISMDEGTEPTGAYQVQILSDGSYKSFEIENDPEINMYVPAEDDIKIDSLILDEISQAIKEHFKVL